MKKELRRLTTDQFARLHEVNKRTLHYYDEIGLFHPAGRADNGYRYYDISQSIDFEYIRMLKELNMSIDEIRAYRSNPTPEGFLRIVDDKAREIEEQIRRLESIRTAMRVKREQVSFCESLGKREIRFEEHEAEVLLTCSYDYSENGVSRVFRHLKDVWGIEQMRMGVGSYISLDHVLHGNFEEYEGVYTVALGNEPLTGGGTHIKPQGRYLCGYQRGTWDELPALYRDMIRYARENELNLAGCAYEIGLNDFVISREADYVTKIMIGVEEGR